MPPTPFHLNLTHISSLPHSHRILSISLFKDGVDTEALHAILQPVLLPWDLETVGDQSRALKTIHTLLPEVKAAKFYPSQAHYIVHYYVAYYIAHYYIVHYIVHYYFTT